VQPFHVAAWIEDFPGSKPTVKQKLAAVRMLYDFLVVRQVRTLPPAPVLYAITKGSNAGVNMHKILFTSSITH
jgi:hypothetical protein